MVDPAAGVLRLLETQRPTILALGTGTGALAARCLDVRPDARLIGIDADAGMLGAARVRLAGRGEPDLRTGSFLDGPLPPCDAIVASLSLHHVPTPEQKQRFFGSCRAALRPNGMLVSADAYPVRDPRLAAVHRETWLKHLERSYPRAESEGYLAAWAGEDFYFPLQDELQWMSEAGFAVEVLWREGSFAVIAAMRK